jgi:hypothetical protein
MPLTKTSTYGANSAVSNLTTAVTVTLDTGSLIVVEWIAENGTGGNLDAATPITTSGAAISFTKLCDTHTVADANLARVAMYAAYSDGTAGSRTITHNRVGASTNQRRMIVHVVEGAAATLAAAIPSGNRKSQITGTTNVGLSFTPAGAGSMLVGSIADWNAVNDSSWTPQTGNTKSNGVGTAGSAYWTAACEPTTNPMSSGSAFTWGATSAGSQFTAAAVEIVPAAAGPSSLIAPLMRAKLWLRPWLYQHVQPASIAASYTMPADTGTLTLAGPTVNLIYSGAGSKVLPAGLGVLTLGGQAAMLRYGHKMPAGLGTLTLSGQAAVLRYGHKMPAGLGTLTLSGQAATLRYSRKMPAARGTIALSGPVVNLIYSGAGSKTLPAGLGILTAAGQPVTLRYARKMTAGLGVVTLSGRVVDLVYTEAAANHYVMTVETGYLALIGQPAGLVHSAKNHYVMAAGSSTLRMTGFPASVYYGPALQQPGVFKFGRRVTIPNRW